MGSLEKAVTQVNEPPQSKVRRGQKMGNDEIKCRRKGVKGEMDVARVSTTGKEGI